MARTGSLSFPHMHAMARTGIHVIWRHQSDVTPGQRKHASQMDPANSQPEYDIEALDSVRIEGVECVLQVIFFLF